VLFCPSRENRILIVFFFLRGFIKHTWSVQKKIQRVGHRKCHKILKRLLFLQLLDPLLIITQYIFQDPIRMLTRSGGENLILVFISEYFTTGPANLILSAFGCSISWIISQAMTCGCAKVCAILLIGTNGMPRFSKALSHS